MRPWKTEFVFEHKRWIFKMDSRGNKICIRIQTVSCPKKRKEIGFEVSWHGKHALFFCKKLNEAGKLAVTARNQNLRDGNYCPSLTRKAYRLDCFDRGRLVMTHKYKGLVVALFDK